MKKNKRCLQCRSSFESDRSDAKYCSARCRQAAYTVRKRKEGWVDKKNEESIVAELRALAKKDRAMLSHIIDGSSSSLQFRKPYILDNLNKLKDTSRKLIEILAYSTVDMNSLEIFLDEFECYSKQWKSVEKIQIKTSVVYDYLKTQYALNTRSTARFYIDHYPIHDELVRIAVINEEEVCEILNL